MIDFQTLFNQDSMNDANGQNLLFNFVDGLYDFLYYNIAPHISTEGRIAYQNAGLCSDTTDESLCPAYFRSQFLNCFDALQNQSSSMTAKLPAKLRCMCLPGNCTNCICVKANRICNRWCHSGNDKGDAIKCLNCGIWDVT